MQPLVSPDDWRLERYRPYLRNVAEKHIDARLRGKLDASDVVQQVMLKAHACRAQFRGSSEPELVAWLQRILATALTDARRAYASAARNVGCERPLDVDSAAGPCAATESPSQHALSAERAGLLNRALDAVPADQQRALVLRYLHGLTVAEVCERMGRSERAVAGLLQRGLAQLRGLLAEAEGAAREHAVAR